jgi:very-short-patch-repair endonuclease
MIVCKICGKEYKRLDSSHLAKSHKISVNDYLEQFPGAEIISKESLELYSNGTSRYFSNKENRKKHVYIRTPEIIQAQVLARQNTIKSNPEIKQKMYLPDRNKKISDSKKNYWQNISDEQRSELLKINVKKARENEGEENYLRRLRKNGIKGYEVASNLSKSKKESSFETEMYTFLSNHDIYFEKQKEVNGWFFDCYIPSKNLLLEFDGDFWHPLTIEDCKYKFQFKRLHTDNYKSKVAIKNGFNIIRIRLSEKEKIKDII